MERNKTDCPQCCGAKTIMIPKETKGFEYKECSLCQGTGVVSTQLADDYIFSLNEDNFETNDDW